MEAAAVLESSFFNWFQKSEKHIPKILIVEDDLALRPLWNKVIEKVIPKSNIQWVLSAESAERAIAAQAQRGEQFDLMVTDIFLAGNNTGIDLWRRHGNSGSRFLVVTSASPAKFVRLLRGEPLPPCIHKPLDLKVCVDTFAELLGKKQPSLRLVQ